MNRTSDAYGGLFNLAGLRFVDGQRIALLGLGYGGRIALTISEAGTTDRHFNPENLTFKAAVAYYPECDTTERSTFPVLVMVEREDQCALARWCEDLPRHRSSDGAPTNLIIYPGVHNGFVENSRVAGIMFGMAWGEYNEKAAEDSLRKARDFLGWHLDGTSR